MIEEDYTVYCYYISIQAALKHNFVYDNESREIKYLWKDIIYINTLDELKNTDSFYNYEHYREMYLDKIRNDR